MGTDYVHGYTTAETRRLTDQAGTLADLLHGDTPYEAGSRVLEVGCGVGAQTVQLLTRSPGIRLTSVDISEESLAHAKARVAAEVPGAEVDWLHADLLGLTPDQLGLFDHLFLCFVLEHLPKPVEALTSLQRLLRPGGSITVIEGDHESAFFHPRSTEAQAVIDCLIDLQAEAGGDSLIGRRLQPLLTDAGYDDVRARPCTVYADETLPHLVDGFTRKTFIAMVESVRDRSLAAGLRTPAQWEQGIRALERAAEPGGTFHYTFFKAVGTQRWSG
ncbi:methyltransferase domain-containing protein [Kribbella qitaiheensis]|uniref:Methyltransferase domain-containing protein n=1 Tax=Kribbella qitaiheensis TaxID=1544730 RepID=A0A7G6X285_9ACTN|nr:L-histidine N(alpha)-methyltransferase [Kribbella qitaiheensis]QNE20350.1 methyltransferase domain-containing protein [Kribbella qitaiheensis]